MQRNYGCVTIRHLRGQGFVFQLDISVSVPVAERAAVQIF